MNQEVIPMTRFLIKPFVPPPPSLEAMNVHPRSPRWSRFLFPVFLFVILFLTGCDSGGANYGGGAPGGTYYPFPNLAFLHGSVLEKGTRVPVAGAVLKIAGKYANSDSTGHYRFGDLTKGEAFLEVSKGGYRPWGMSINLTGSHVKTVYLTPITAGTTLARPLRAGSSPGALVQP